MSAADEVALVDTVNGTNLCTSATAGTKIVVDSGEIVLDGDSTLGTGLLTLHTADTTVGAILTGESTLILVGALNDNAGGVVDEVDDTVGALAYTDATADTLAGVNVSYAVFNGNSLLGTNSCTVAVAKACEGAVLVTAVSHVGGKAGLVTLVVALSGCSVARTVAGNECNLLNNVLCLNAEDGRDILCGAVATGHTEVGLVGRLFSKSFSIAVASGVTARATVSTGQAVTDSNSGLVLLDSKEYACQGEQSGTHDSDADEDEGRNKNCHITTPFLCEQVFHHACKSEECECNDGCCYESNGYTLECLGRGAVLDSRAYSCEEHHCEKEAETYAERGDHGLYEVILCGDIVEGNAENCTVCSDEGKIYTERLVERGNELLKNDLYELNESGDNKDEYDGLEVFKL